MPELPDPQSDSPQAQEISLDELSRAYADAMAEPEPPGGQPDEQVRPDETAGEPAVESSAEPTDSAPVPDVDQGDDDSCELCPRSILEAMLFVGNRENRPLTSSRAAELMRGVEPSGIPGLVDELNRGYAAAGCPYHVVGEGAGYRLVLRESFHRVRDKFYGRIREARLSQAAIDVLAIVAYQQPLTADEVSTLRGKPSSHLLRQLVRRRLLRIERPSGQRSPAAHFTTDRFLELFRMESLEDLPRAEELEHR